MITIRDIEPADMPAVTTIYEHHTLYGAGTFDETPLSLDDMRARADKVSEQGLPWLVAISENGEIAGYAYAVHFHSRFGWRFTVENSVYVAPNQQRQGIGKTLLSELIRRCEKLGYRQMIAAIGDSENHGSIGLHKMMGFAPAGVYKTVGVKFGRWLDVVLMQKTLGEGAKTVPDNSISPEKA
ncbi:MAG: GNAT family N-acetyltransferase [Hyphomicrobiales bacterium]|nr:GNAT family N-acetyltransferase [Hyphomicrobiales bacterium]